MRALILAGGRGTRLRPLTNHVMKPLLPFMGEPYTKGLLRRLATAGVRQATVVVGAEAEPWAPLHEHGDAVGVRVAIATEEQRLDTAGGVRRLLATGADTAETLVLNGDILTDLDLPELLAAHRQARAVATIALTRVPDTSAFGVVLRDSEGFVTDFIEKPEPGTTDQNTVNAGTYVLNADAFDDFPGDGPLSFERDVFPGLVDAGRPVLGAPSDAWWGDLGTPERYLEGHRAVLEGECAWPLAPGLLHRDGGNLVAEDARIADDADVRGSVLGQGCEVAEGAVVVGSVLHERVRIGAGSRVRDSILGEGASVGDGVRVEPLEVLEQGSHRQ